MKKTLLIVLLLLVGCEKKTTAVPSIIKQAAEERSLDLGSTSDNVLELGGKDEGPDTIVKRDSTK